MSTKARILETAEEVFAAKGFKGASTREIAARAGVNISSLHYHCGSKEHLYLAVLHGVYERIVALVRNVGSPAANARGRVDVVVETAMGQLFDFFHAHPTISKLLLRRLVEDEAGHIKIERDVLAPAWKVFAGWTRHFRSPPIKETDSMLFMLTAYSIMLLMVLDSREFQHLLGGSVREPAVRKRVRMHIVRVVQRLLENP